jgi:hypothetical protein
MRRLWRDQANGIKPANFSFQSLVPAMRLRGAEQALERAAPLPMIVEIANDPAARPGRSGD